MFCAVAQVGLWVCWSPAGARRRTGSADLMAWPWWGWGRGWGQGWGQGQGCLWPWHRNEVSMAVPDAGTTLQTGCSLLGLELKLHPSPKLPHICQIMPEFRNSLRFLEKKLNFPFFFFFLSYYFLKKWNLPWQAMEYGLFTSRLGTNLVQSWK